MKKKKRTGLRFDTEKNARSLRIKRFVAAFSCFFVLLGGISFLLLLSHYDYNLSAITTPGNEQTTEEETEVQPAPQVEGKRNYLVFCTADNSNAVRFISVITADLNDNVLTVKGLDTTTTISVSGCTGNFEKQLDYGGTKQLVLAVEKHCGITVDKHVRSTDNNFKSIINYIGGIEVTVEKPIDIRTPDLTAIIGAGKQTMTGDTMLKYMRSFEGNPQKQASIIALMAEQKITTANLEKSDRYYEKIVNLTDNDISALDFSGMKLGFEALLYENGKVSVKTAS